MSFARRYATAMVVPPLAVALPLALWFLGYVNGLSPRAFVQVAIVATAVYGAGAAAAARMLAGQAHRVSDDLAQRRDASGSVSRALQTGTLLGLAQWVGLGFVLAMIGAAVYARSALVVQYFIEAALIVAAPSMAWTYWAGKKMLVREAGTSASLMYRGRVWSIAVKIAIVFIGFFIVSTGALVLVISSYVASHIGEQAAYSVGRFGLLISAIATVIFGLATWFLARDVIAPMRELVRLSTEMAQGQFTSQPRAFADDETGVVLGSFLQTRKKLLDLINSIGNRGRSVTDGVRVMSDGTSALVENARAQNLRTADSTRAVTMVRNASESVVSDVVQVEAFASETTASTVELRASFAEVGRRMDELFTSVEKSSSAAAQIDAAARETAGSTSALASVGNDVFAFVTQMDATIASIRQTAEQTANLSQQVKQDAGGGSAAVAETVAGIRGVQESVRRLAEAFDALRGSLGQIDQILLFIDDVTNRTNLLALNAAIIASQAGSSDNGFSVIADEVRQLADRTRTATKEISGIIRGVQPVSRQAAEALDAGTANVDRTVMLATNASKSLSTILESADRSLEMARSISNALAEQSEASRYLQGVTAQMAERIADARRATEGQAEATAMLAQEAERVSDIALQVKKATEEQTNAAGMITAAMARITDGITSARRRAETQFQQCDQVAAASTEMLTLAERNAGVAEQFRASLDTLLRTGQEFESEVERFRA